MLRNLLRRSPANRLIAGTPQVGLLASQIISETATGDQGPGLLYDDALANTSKLLRVKVTSWNGTAGTLFVYENGSILVEGQADGAYAIGYDWEAWAANGTLTTGSDTASVQIGPLSATAPGATVSGGGSVVGGAATGGASGDAFAAGATVAGAGSITGGSATGEQNAIAAGASVTGSGSVVGGSASGDAFTGSLSDADIARIAAAVIAALNATTGARTLGQHLQIQTAVLAGNESGAGTGHIAFTDGAATVEADVPLPGQTGNRSNVTISGV